MTCIPIKNGIICTCKTDFKCLWCNKEFEIPIHHECNGVYRKHNHKFDLIEPSESKQDKEHSEMLIVGKNYFAEDLLKEEANEQQPDKELKTKIIKQNGSYKVQFSIGVQYFTLDYEGDKVSCRWMIKMLEHAFKEYAEQYHKSRIRDELKIIRNHIATEYKWLVEHSPDYGVIPKILKYLDEYLSKSEETKIK